MQLYEGVTDEDVWYYWKSLFPEVKDENKIVTLLNVCEPFEMERLDSFYNKYSKRVYSIPIEEEEIIRDITLDKYWSEFIKSNSIYNTFYPVIRYKWKKFTDLEQVLERLPIVRKKDTIMRSVLQAVCDKLIEVSMRTLILEINTEKGQKNLKGKNGKERFHYYTDVLWRKKEYIHKFYVEYHHLLELQLNVINSTVTYCMEVIENTWAHYDEIKRTFFEREEHIYIEEIEFELGDSHKGGKTVAAIVFSNEKKLIYKPRSLGAEFGFLEYTREINAGMQLEMSALYELTLLDCGEFGFVQYIEERECHSKEEIQRYYYRSGCMMAMLHSLNAKDIHHENLIASGEYPVIIDLEALFHSRLEYGIAQSEQSAYNKADGILDQSVYSIGLLPINFNNPYDNEGVSVDISGFGGESEQVSPFSVLMVKNKETDEIRLEKSAFVIKSQKNLPRYKGVVANATDYQQFIQNGFEDTYLYIMKHKEYLIGKIKDWFAGVNTRIIYRSTFLYAKLIFTGYHPDFMRQRIHRYVLFHRMGYRVKQREYPLVKAEIEDMMNGDVPFFEIDIHTGRIRDSKGNPFDLTFKKTPYDMVKDKINDFSYDDLQFQKMIINNAFVSKDVKTFQNMWVTGSNWQEENESSIDYLESAKKIGRYLLSKAERGTIDGESDLCWINFTPVGEDAIHYQFEPVGSDLYSGNSGIALFFLYLWKVTKESDFLDAAYASMNAVIQKMREISCDSSYLIGAYNGLGGYLYVLSKFYLETANNKIISIISDGLKLMKSIYMKDTNYDVISGSAGAIKVCLSLYRNYTGVIKKQAEELIELLTEHLLDNYVEEQGGIAWKSGVYDHIYTGYAHGNSGIEEALSGVYEIWPSERLKDVIQKSANFVQSMYDINSSNWKTVYGREDYSNAWCHGAPGILYSKFRQLEVFDYGEDKKEELCNNLRTMMKRFLGNNICYCHGDIGNIELVKHIAKIVGDRELIALCDSTYSSIAPSFFTYINERELLSFGLMLGVSGIGYSLLRAVSEDVPSIMILA